jgi:hypothetical protein
MPQEKKLEALKTESTNAEVKADADVKVASLPAESVTTKAKAKLPAEPRKFYRSIGGDNDRMSIVPAADATPEELDKFSAYYISLRN